MTKVFLVCSGLGRINRGYETFTQECFDALAGAPELNLTLFKGGGTAAEKQQVLWNLPRLHAPALRLGKILGKDGYLVEQMTFGIALLPHLLRQNPDVVYFSDISLGKMLWHWRRVSRTKFVLLFRNGGPMKPPYPLWDLTQQLVQVHQEAALAAGHPPHSQVLLPPGIAIAPELDTPTAENRAALHRTLGLPENRPLILSVGAVNKNLKRMDYVVREVAALPEPRPFLLMLGQEDEETPEIRTLASAALGPHGYEIRTVPSAEVKQYYQAADIFVLATRLEGFGRAYVEALSWGLPCLAHDSPLTRDIVGADGLLGDFEQPGMLTGLLTAALAEGYDIAARRRRHRNAFRRFSWQEIRPQYVAMFQRCAALRVYAAPLAFLVHAACLAGFDPAA